MDEKLAAARARLLKLSEAAEADGEPLRWFEELYAGANRDSEEIPWAKMEANPKMVEWIAENPDVQIQLEGHCDERGTNEYNLALGERRAKAVFDYLVSLGASPSQFSMVSFGEERPAASGSNESAWKQNRRVEFTRL